MLVLVLGSKHSKTLIYSIWCQISLARRLTEVGLSQCRRLTESQIRRFRHHSCRHRHTHHFSSTIMKLELSFSAMNSLTRQSVVSCAPISPSVNLLRAFKATYQAKVSKLLNLRSFLLNLKTSNILLLLQIGLSNMLVRMSKSSRVRNTFHG